MEPSDVTDLLHTLAEVSIAFVGFSTIVAALQSGGDAAFKVYSIRDVAIVGLVVLGACVLPLVLGTFGVGHETLWRVASLALSVGWITSAVWGIRSYSRNVESSIRPKYLIVGPITGLIANPLLWYNAALPGPSAGPIYGLAVILPLVFASVSFIAAAFHEVVSGA